MKRNLFTIICLLLSIDLLAQNSNLQGAYQCTGYFFHPSASRAINLSKNITQVAPNRYQMAMADLASLNFFIQFDVDANNNLVNWVSVGATPASPQSGYMTTDNPGAFTFYPGGTSGYVHSTYNNKYNPITKTFYLHYGYQTGATGQAQYQRQIYEQCTFTAGPPIISTFTYPTVSYRTQINLTGKNFTGAFPFFGGGVIKVDSFSIVADSLMSVWPGGGINASGRLFIQNSFSTDSTIPYQYTAPSVSNTTWQYAGPAGFAATRSRYGINMAITKTNIPHIAFVDSLGRARVMKYTASTNVWSVVGGTISDGVCSHINIKLDNNNIPFVAYIDSLNGNRLTVKKLSGTSWVTVGTSGFTKLVKFSDQNTVPLAIDGANVPYVLSSDSAIGIYQLAVMRFNSTSNSWMFNGIVTNDYNDYYTIDIDKNTNAVYVSYGSPVNYQVSVQKFMAGSSSSWVGSAEFTGSPIGSFYPTVRVDKNGNPFLIAQDDDTHERLSLYSFNGTNWSKSGGFRFSKGHSYAPSLVFDKSNNPVVAFTDATYNGLGSVMQRTNTGAWVFTGDRGFQPGTNLANSLAVDTTNTPFVAFIDYTNNNRISVMRLRSTLSAYIRQFSPTASLAGGTITIKGIGFTGARAVKFNTTAATSFTVVNDSTITAVVGAGATGAINITTSTGGIISKDGFVFCSTPTISSVVTGPTDVCPSIGGDTASTPVLYTIRRILNVNVYNWTVPSGAVIVSGQGDTGILVRFARSFISGTISVVAVNQCGQTSDAKTLIVYKRVAATPGTIQKEFFPSITAVTNVCGLTSEIYKIRKVLYATAYDWRLRFGTGATIQHLNPLGENDTAIRVVFSQSLIRDTITVASISACSVGTPTYVHVSTTGTVAGGNGLGAGSNQLNSPNSIFVDRSGNIFISDHSNHRVMRWAPGATNGTVVAGGNGFGSALNQLAYPEGVFVDRSGNLFVCDNSNHRVLRFSPGSTSGVVVAGGNGQGSGLNQLSYPGGVVVDSLGRVYISDAVNFRVVRWSPGATSGVVVAGGNGPGANLNQLLYPHGIFVDGAFNIFVADDNNRIVRWSPGATNGVIVAGGNGSGSSTNQFNGSNGVYVDRQANIYVADVTNHRIQKFAPGSVNGITIAGGNGSGTSLTQLNLPSAVFVDSVGSVYTCDRGNNRIQRLLPYTPPAITTTSRVLAITTQLVPPTVSAINGSLTPCIGNTLTYTAIAPAPTATQAPIRVYRWTKPNFTTITSATADSSTITLSYITGYTGGTISAKAQSVCGVIGVAKTITLQYLPPTPSNIISRTGSYNACIGDTITYSVAVPTPTAAQTVASVYRWTRPSNTQVLSAATDSSRILIRFNTGYAGGSLSVRGQTNCGVLGTAKTVTLPYLPPTPSNITSRTGTYNACIGDTITYRVVVSAPSATQRVASVYRWTKPNNTQILSAPSDSSTVLLKFNAGYTGGTITVKGQTACGVQGVAKSVTLTHTACPTGTGNLPTAKVSEQSNMDELSISPNPSHNNFTLRQTIQKSVSNQTTSVELINMNGVTIKKWSMNTATYIFGDDLQAGVYLLRTTRNGVATTQKIIKQ